MPRRAAGLTAASAKVAPIGRHGDGDGLYLLVRSPEIAFWVFRYTREKKTREMGLGRARGPNKVDLAVARQRVRDLRAIIQSGRDPLDERDAKVEAQRAQAQQAALQAITFKSVADTYIRAHRASWQNAKHAGQWSTTLTTHVFPHFGDVPVAEVGTGHVLAALQPIWSERPETAVRVRGRVEAVLDYAKAMNWRQGENPATWRGHLAKLLPSRAKMAPIRHHAALPYSQVTDFMAQLRGQKGMAARALEFTIMTAARSGETLGATWGEIDLEARTWTVPAARMKAKREHRVPLSEPVVALLNVLAQLRTAEDRNLLVFPGARPGKPLTIIAMAGVLQRMGRRDITVHGFRSTFRDWTAEKTSVPNEVAEAALAHVVGDKVEAAYRRGDLFEKRRELMEGWSGYIILLSQ